MLPLLSLPLWSTFCDSPHPRNNRSTSVLVCCWSLCRFLLSSTIPLLKYWHKQNKMNATRAVTNNIIITIIILSLVFLKLFNCDLESEYPKKELNYCTIQYKHNIPTVVGISLHSCFCDISDKWIVKKNIHVYCSICSQAWKSNFWLSFQSKASKFKVFTAPKQNNFMFVRLAEWFWIHITKMNLSSLIQLIKLTGISKAYIKYFCETNENSNCVSSTGRCICVRTYEFVNDKPQMFRSVC